MSLTELGRREWFREHVVATGQVAVSIAGERPGVPWPDGTG
jgi:hypothetical protein